MATFKTLVSTVCFVCAGVASAYGQTLQTEAEQQLRARTKVATMEGVLVNAINQGAQSVILQVRKVIPGYSPRTVPARVSGVRLEGFGILFTVDVPQIPLPFGYNTLLLEVQTRNALMRIQQFRNEANGMTEGPERNERLAQADQLERALALGNFRVAQPSRGSVAAQSLVPVGVTRTGPVETSVVDDPEEAYTREVKGAIIDAMLQSSQVLELKADEWLVIVARDGTPTNPQSPADAIDASVQVMKVKGSALAAFQARTITLEEARKQVEVTEQ